MCLMEVGGRGCYGAQEKLVAARCPRRKETSASQRHSDKGKLARFKVRSKYLLLIAAAVWLIAGSQVARMGIEAIAAGNGNPWLLLIGIPATFVVFHMMFSKLVGKHAARIRSYGEEKMHVLKFFDVRGYLIMAVMMGGGIALRSFHLVPGWFIAFFYTGLGIALALAGVGFLVHYFHRDGYITCPVTGKVREG